MSLGAWAWLQQGVDGTTWEKLSWIGKRCLGNEGTVEEGSRLENIQSIVEYEARIVLWNEG